MSALEIAQSPGDYENHLKKAMDTRKLGNSNLQITRQGFGAWAIGGGNWEFSWGPQDDKDSIEAIHKALEVGVNWIDTAAVYIPRQRAFCEDVGTLAAPLLYSTRDNFLGMAETDGVFQATDFMLTDEEVCQIEAFSPTAAKAAS